MAIGAPTGAAVTNVSAVSPVGGLANVFTVSVSTGTDDGVINLNVNAGSVKDEAGNNLGVNTSATDQSYDVATTRLELSSGVLTITDIRSNTTDSISLSVDGTNLVISDAGNIIAGDGLSFTQNGNNEVRIALAQFASIVVNGEALADAVTIASALSKNVTLNVETVNLKCSHHRYRLRFCYHCQRGC